MRWIRSEALRSPLFAGTWLSLGSSVAAEISASCAFDWILIDLEHGLGGYGELLHQLQAIGERVSPIVRVPCIDANAFKQTLDLGPAGLMVPNVNTPAEAQKIVEFSRIRPAGTRGIAQSTRASGYTSDFKRYVREINDNLLIMAQIESREAVSNVEAIAAVDGIDVLFVGPLDLSIDLGLDPDANGDGLQPHLERVVSAARDNGKAAGILLRREEQIKPHLDLGFTVVTLGSDRGLIGNGMRTISRQFESARAALADAKR